MKEGGSESLTYSSHPACHEIYATRSSKGLHGRGKSLGTCKRLRAKVFVDSGAFVLGDIHPIVYRGLLEDAELQVFSTELFCHVWDESSSNFCCNCYFQLTDEIQDA